MAELVSSLTTGKWPLIACQPGDSAPSTLPAVMAGSARLKDGFVLGSGVLSERR